MLGCQTTNLMFVHATIGFHQPTCFWLSNAEPKILESAFSAFSFQSAGGGAYCQHTFVSFSMRGSLDLEKGKQQRLISSECLSFMYERVAGHFTL